jgi:hypothetical protein
MRLGGGQYENHVLRRFFEGRSMSVHAFSRSEFLAMADIGEQAGHIKEDESRIIRNIVVTLVVLGAIIGVFGALGAHAARNGVIAGPSAQWAILIVPVAVGFLASAFMLPGVIARVLRLRFLGQRP